MEKIDIKPNKDNDLKFVAGLVKPSEEPMNENTNNEESPLEYFTE